MFASPVDMDGVAAVLPHPEGYDPEMGWEDPQEGNLDEQMLDGGVTPLAPPQVGHVVLPPPAAQAVVPKASGMGGPDQAKPRTLAIAFASLGLSSLIRDPLLAALQCDGEADPEILTALPETDLQQVVDQVQVGDSSRSASPFERAQIFLFFKKLRALWAEPSPQTGTPLPVATAPITVTLPDTSSRLYYKDILDQTVGNGWFTLLPLDELRNLRRRFVAHTGAPAEGDGRPSDAQISAMANWIRPQPNGSLQPPFAEFAVFGPFHGRNARLRQFTAHVLTRDGTWSHRLLRSPPSFQQWSACWKVYANTLIMLDVAKIGQLQQYYSGISRLFALYPKDWPSIAAYDEEMRSEIWPRLQQELADGTLDAPTGHDFARPWGTIIASTRFGYLSGLRADWWREREIVLERGQSSRPGGRSQAPLGDGIEPPPLPSFSRVGQQADGWGSGAEAKDRPQPKAKPAPKPQQGKGQGKTARTVGNTGLLVMKKGPCWFCGGAHFREQCHKWIAAGRPDKGQGKGQNKGETQGAGGAESKQSKNKKRKAKKA